MLQEREKWKTDCRSKSSSDVWPTEMVSRAPIKNVFFRQKFQTAQPPCLLSGDNKIIFILHTNNILVNYNFKLMKITVFDNKNIQSHRFNPYYIYRNF